MRYSKAANMLAVAVRTIGRSSVKAVQVPVARLFASVPVGNDVDPMQVFEQIDTNGDNVLSREEFMAAVEQMHYSDLLKIKKSLARNELSFNPDADDELLGQTFLRRCQVTAEVGMSKIFPAGFGWQAAATLADNAGLQATDTAFFISTGVGDGLGVLLGHSLYMATKKAVTGNENIDVQKEVETGIFLGSAAFLSGSAWQMTVNALQASGWSFESSVVATGGVCGLAFFSGLRVGRLFYGKVFKGVASPTYANLKADAALSVAVGGAAGGFLGTDVSYGGANWLSPVVGIEQFHTAVTASSLAGTSTFIGFGIVQTAENVVYPKDKCWVD